MTTPRFSGDEGLSGPNSSFRKERERRRRFKQQTVPEPFFPRSFPQFTERIKREFNRSIQPGLDAIFAPGEVTGEALLSTIPNASPGIGSQGPQRFSERNRATRDDILNAFRGTQSPIETFGSLRERFNERPFSEQLLASPADPIELLPGTGKVAKATARAAKSLDPRIRLIDELNGIARGGGGSIGGVPNLPPLGEFREGLQTSTINFLPREGQNTRLNDLSTYTDRVFHETSLNDVEVFIPTGGKSTDLGDVFLSNSPNLARGQGGKGVLLEFDATNIPGAFDFGKPLAKEVAETSGEAEFVSRLSRQSDFKKNLISIRIESDALVDKINARRMPRVLDKLEELGWIKRQGDGFIEWRKPSATEGIE